MSETCETVTVVRKDHPNGRVDINKDDMVESDVVWTPEPPTIDELRTTLTDAGVEFKAKANKAELQALVDSLTIGG